MKRPAVRYHGAKFRLATWLLRFMPPHTCYVEPFGGAAGLLLQKPRAYAEVYNDLDGDIVNFFRVLRDPAQRARLIEAVALTPYARDEFEQSWLPATDPIERARLLVIRAQMGFGSAGASKATTGFRIDTRRKHGTAQHLWSEYPSAIEDAGQRFSGVMIENRPAIDVMRQHDGQDTLLFVDPPYMHETRVRVPRTGYYRHEMSSADHEQLLEFLCSASAMVMLCGYDTDLYHQRLPGWAVHRTRARISASRGTVLRTEVLWLNPACAAALERRHGGLFAEAA